MVNNNAAAVLITMDALCSGGEVVVARGQLVEIGGSFRIPDVMERSGATLREVGCTNRVHPQDYENAINERTVALMRVHTSNYRIVGFTESASREELAALFEGARVILADALCTLCGAPPAEPRDEQALRAVLGSRLTKAQILGTIELLETYRNHCEYNVGVGPLLGGLAVELEEIL